MFIVRGERKSRTPTNRRKAERRFIMSEKKMTRKEALEIAIAACDNEEAIEVLKKMLVQVTKPRKRAEGPSKARRENERLLADVLAASEDKGEPVTSKWLTEHVRGLMTPQKVTAVAKIGIENGSLVRNKEGKVITYSLPE